MISYNPKGAITVFISIVFSAVFLVVGTFTDGARLRIAHSQVQRANKTALSSVLASYNNDLKDEYGLFGVYLDEDTFREAFEEYFAKNLNISENQNFLYNFNIEEISVKQLYSLADTGVFNNQIMEFMKYRAPYELATNLANKFKGINKLSGGSKILGRKLQTDKKSGEIGELQQSLEIKTRKINESRISALTDFKKQFEKNKEILKEKTASLIELQSRYSNESDEKKKNSLQKNIQTLGNEIKKLNGAVDNLKKSILSTVENFKLLNSQALAEAKTLINKKIELQQRINGELAYTKGLQDEIREIRDSYMSDLNEMNRLMGEDNSSTIISGLQKNTLICDGIANIVQLNDEDFLNALESLSSQAEIDYQYNKAVFAESKDKDNRDRASEALSKTFRKEENLNTIDDSLLKLLPSRKARFEAENTVQTWDKMSFEDLSCITDNLDYISQKENIFGDLAGKAVEELYINEYIMGTFMHDVPLLQDQQEKEAYNLRSRDKTKRDAFFSKYEVEYIINGNKSEAVNSLLLKFEILSIRLISNVIHIYTDTLKMSRVTSLAAALSSWCAGLSTPLIQTMLIFSWAMLESLYDMYQLSKGGQIPLLKAKEEWKTDLSGEIIKNYSKGINNNVLNLTYQDYLKIFLITMKNDKKLARVQDLVQLNKSVSSPGFLLDDCKAFLEANSVVSIKNLFISVPLFTAGSRKSVARSYLKEDTYLGY